MAILQQLFFLITLGVAGYILRKRILRIRDNIQLGKKNDIVDHKSERLNNVLMIALGQRKMFKRIIPATLHFFIYVGFLVINLEVLEFIIDGLAGTHRIFAPYLGGFYNVLMNIFEFLAIGVLFACISFLTRRNILNVQRFHSAEMTKWPRLDGNLILMIEIVLMFAILFMNASDQLLQTRDDHFVSTGVLFFSSFLTPLLQNLETPTLIFIERFAWWFHIIGILGFSIYVTYSKHLHIFIAFPNTYYAKLESKGTINNMPVVTREVKSMLGLGTADATTTPSEPGRFGAKDIQDLNWNNLMAADACTECGRVS